MTSKEALEKLINDIEEQNEIVSKEPHLIINVKVNAEIFIPLLHNIKQDLELLEKLESEVKRKSGIICMLESEIESLHTEIESLHTEIKSVSSETEEQFKKFLDKENQKLKLSRESIKNNYVELVDKLVKENKNLKEEMGMYIDTNNKFYDEIEKLKKVIEILERFNFTIYTTKYNNNETEFKIYTDSLLETEELTQEEYELLKEYLDEKED